MPADQERRWPKRVKVGRFSFGRGKGRREWFECDPDGEPRPSAEEIREYVPVPDTGEPDYAGLLQRAERKLEAAQNRAEEVAGELGRRGFLDSLTRSQRAHIEKLIAKLTNGGKGE